LFEVKESSKHSLEKECIISLLFIVTFLLYNSVLLHNSVLTMLLEALTIHFRFTYEQEVQGELDNVFVFPSLCMMELVDENRFADHQFQQVWH